jgi:hypothetical protein
MPQDVFTRVATYIEEENLILEDVEKKSRAAGGIFVWIELLLKFHDQRYNGSDEISPPKKTYTSKSPKKNRASTVKKSTAKHAVEMEEA